MTIARRIASGILPPLLVFAGFLLAVELGARMSMQPYASRDFFLTLFGDPPDATPPNQQPLFRGDPVLFWRLRPSVEGAVWDFTKVSTNADGIRHPRPIGDTKPAGRFRIVCVGDSVTFGYRVPLVFPADPDSYDREDAPYAGRLERMLAKLYPDHDVEVIALAVPGYTSHQGRIFLEETIDWLDPDVVVICFGFNDVARKHFPDKVTMSRDFVPTALRTILSSSQTLLHAWRWYTNRPGDQPPLPEPGPRVAREDYLDNIAAMAALARSRGAAVLVVGPVYRDRVTTPAEAKQLGFYRAALRDSMLAQGIPYTQIDELTEAGYPGNKELFGEHVHPSSSGHQLMAERILEAMRKDGMLAPLGTAGTAS